MSLSLNLLTTSELSTLIKRAPETLIRWRRLRVGPPYLLVEGRVLYDEADVRQWLDGRRAQNKPSRTREPEKAARSTVASPIRASGFRFSPDTRYDFQTPQEPD